MILLSPKRNTDDQAERRETDIRKVRHTDRERDIQTHKLYWTPLRSSGPQFGNNTIVHTIKTYQKRTHRTMLTPKVKIPTLIIIVTREKHSKISYLWKNCRPISVGGLDSFCENISAIKIKLLSPRSPLEQLLYLSF